MTPAENHALATILGHMARLCHMAKKPVTMREILQDSEVRKVVARRPDKHQMTSGANQIYIKKLFTGAGITKSNEIYTTHGFEVVTCDITKKRRGGRGHLPRGYTTVAILPKIGDVYIPPAKQEEPMAVEPVLAERKIPKPVRVDAISPFKRKAAGLTQEIWDEAYIKGALYGQESSEAELNALRAKVQTHEAEVREHGRKTDELVERFAEIKEASAKLVKQSKKAAVDEYLRGLEEGAAAERARILGLMG